MAVTAHGSPHRPYDTPSRAFSGPFKLAEHYLELERAYPRFRVTFYLRREWKGDVTS